MAQEKIKMNQAVIWPPDKDLSAAFATTYTEASGRTQRGKAILVPLFTVEQMGYKATKIPIAEATKIIRIVAKGKKFKLHYFSPYYGVWRDADFYVGQGDMTIGSLDVNNMYYEELSFNMQGVDPI